MGILDNYAIIHNCRVEVPRVAVYEKPKPEAVHILGDIRQVTIAEIHPSTMGQITAHRLKDYRRKRFSLMLLPDVEIMLDYLLQEVPSLEEYAEFKSFDN